MPLKYSCFVSYRHSSDDIVTRLQTALETEIPKWLNLKIYVDKSRLQGGNFFNGQLARALCESVCWIVIYTPTYFDKSYTYCAREYRAMEYLERRRLQLLNIPRNQQTGFIIPIIYRGEVFVPTLNFKEPSLS